MSNKQKYIQVLATIVQPEFRNYKESLEDADKTFDINMKLVKEIPVNEVMEMFNYLAMALNSLSKFNENTRLHDIVLDDVKTRMHDLHCPRCKGLQPEARCGREAPEQEETTPSGIPVFGSLDELVEKIKNGELGESGVAAARIDIGGPKRKLS